MRLAVIAPLLAAALAGGCAGHSGPPAAPAPGNSQGAVIAIVGATVVHPEAEGAAALAPDNTVLISGNRITAVGPAAATRVPGGATVIDAHGKWVIPGLIDSHVHFFQSGDLYTRPDVVDLGFIVPYAAEVQRNQARLPQTFRVWLASGVTSVADVGGPFWNFDVRDAARATPATSARCMARQSSARWRSCRVPDSHHYRCCARRPSTAPRRSA